MPLPEANQLASQLDEHHLPETNGRMAVCRRCGFRVTGPLGAEQHTAAEERPDRARRWLDGQSRMNEVRRSGTRSLGPAGEGPDR